MVDTGYNMWELTVRVSELCEMVNLASEFADQPKGYQSSASSRRKRSLLILGNPTRDGSASVYLETSICISTGTYVNARGCLVITCTVSRTMTTFVVSQMDNRGSTLANVEMGAQVLKLSLQVVPKIVDRTGFIMGLHAR
jgi:hypothetical protein